VSPKEGPIEGGTRLTIRGSNLGRNKEDVVGLYVCGSNVLSSLEYVSSSKLICTTKPYKPCAGTISVETQVGGRGVSLVQFTFNETTSSPPVPAASVPSVAASVAAASGSSGSMSSLRSAVPAMGSAVTENYSDTTSECSSSLSRSSSRGDADIKREASIKVHTLYNTHVLVSSSALSLLQPSLSVIVSCHFHSSYCHCHCHSRHCHSHCHCQCCQLIIAVI